MFAAVLVAGCTATPGDLDDRPRARFDTIDERAGSYGPVRIGDTEARVFAAFGKDRARPNERLSPTGTDEFFGPTYIATTSPLVYRYPDAAFLVDDRGRVELIQITSPGAATARGIEIGDGLDQVRERYPGFRCGTAPAGDYAEFEYCAGRIGDGPHVWFGGDPVADITMSSAGFGGY